MEIKEFINNFAEAMELDDTKDLTAGTIFREMPEWDSLSYLSIIAMMDEIYDVQIETAEFKQLITLADICNYIDKH